MSITPTISLKVEYRVSEAGRLRIKGFEGKSLKAYQDGGGVWTIGFGHTGSYHLDGRTTIKAGDVISDEEAEQLLIIDLMPPEVAISQNVRVPLNQNEVDSLASFTFNVGVGAFLRSHLLIYLNQGDRTRAAAQMPLWDHVSGRVSGGLLSRRLAERDWFLTPIPTTQPVPAP